MIDDLYESNINLNNAFCLDEGNNIDNNVPNNFNNYIILFEDTYTPMNIPNNHPHNDGFFTTCNCCCN